MIAIFGQPIPLYLISILVGQGISLTLAQGNDSEPRNPARPQRVNLSAADMPYQRLAPPRGKFVETTIRLAEMPYQRMTPSRGEFPPTHIELAHIKWETAVVHDPFPLLERADPALGSWVYDWFARLRRGEKTSSEHLAELETHLATSHLPSRVLRDVGWSLSYIAGTHEEGRLWYHAATAVAQSELTRAATWNQNPQETLDVLYSMRAKLYGIADWEGLQHLCEVAIPAQTKGSNREFWWRVFHAQSYFYRSMPESRAMAVEVIDGLRAVVDEYALPPRELTDFHWTAGLILYQNGHRDKAIAHFEYVVADKNAAHRDDAIALLVVALVRMGKLQEAEAHYQTLLQDHPQGTFVSFATVEISAARRGLRGEPQ
jgi:tetratricopeptide (TPR) repeat protein